MINSFASLKVLFAQLKVSLFFITFIVACSPKANNGSDSGAQTVFFANSILRSNSVSVCWEFTSSSMSSFRSEFQAVISKAFAKTKLRFTGWNECPETEGNPDFRIFIYDDKGLETNTKFMQMKSMLVGGGRYPGHPRVRVNSGSDSRWILGQKAGIVLNTTFTDSFPEVQKIYQLQSERGKYNLSLSSSVHEFGHAIGLRHEDAHSDNQCVAFDENPLPGDVQIGPWNPTSFMERCHYRNFDYDTGIVWPNELDIQGINQRY